MRRVGARLAALFALVGVAAWAGAAAAATKPAVSMPSIKKEVLVLVAGTGTWVNVFEEVALAGPAPTAWTVPLPEGAVDVAPQSAHDTHVHGTVTAPAGTSDASVVYKLPGRLGSVFVQNLSLPLGSLSVLAGPDVYPAVGTGLTLRGQTRINGQAGKTFVLFSGGAQGPGGLVHFSLTVGNPGMPWADAMGVLLVLWLAAGGYLGGRRLMAVLRASPTDAA